MIGHLCAFSCSNCDSEAKGGPIVVEVLGAPPREGIGPRCVDPEALKPGDSATVGEDVEQSQEVGMDPSRSRHDAGDECEGHLSRSVRSAVFEDLGVGHTFQSSEGISTAESAISTNIRHDMCVDGPQRHRW